MKLALLPLTLVPLATVLVTDDTVVAVPAAAAEGVAWSEVLGPSQGVWPEPRERVSWDDDLRAGLAAAQESGRPVFAVVRCLPCKQCATFDRDVLEGGPELSPLLARFETVRLTDAFQLDPDVLPLEGFQDLDLSWWGWFLSPDGRVYGTFGGKDEVGDDSRVSVAALARTLERVLDHHADPRRLEWGLDGAAPVLGEEASSPRALPGFESWARSSAEFGEQTCLHCHQVAEVLRQPALEAGTFVKPDDAWVWPYPENVGLTVDRDDGLLVTAVAPGSSAAGAGLAVGDRLAAAGGRRLYSQTDLRAALHRSARPAGSVGLVWTREGAVHEGELRLAAGWRETVLDWRMSISQGNVGPHPGFPFPQRGPRELAVDGGLSIKPFFGRDAEGSRAWIAGLRPNHVIVGVNGANPNLVGRAFLVWFRLHHEVGEEVVLTVVDEGVTREIRYELSARP